MFRSNEGRMDEAVRHMVQLSGLEQLAFCVKVAEYQIRKGSIFLLEHPLSASSWRTETIKILTDYPQVASVRGDQ